MQVDEATVRRIARLARIKISEAEALSRLVNTTNGPEYKTASSSSANT